MDTDTQQILAFAGSTRKESLNRKLLQFAIHKIEAIGGKVTLLNLGEYNLPLYNADFEKENGLPTEVIRLKTLFKSHAGFLIASPEYNSSITPLLKNTIDWVSRPFLGEFELECYKGKVAALMSASPGALGGIRSLFALRTLLSNIRVLVLPELVAVPKADKIIDEKGNLTDAKLQSQLEAQGKSLKKMVESLSKL